MGYHNDYKQLNSVTFNGRRRLVDWIPVKRTPDALTTLDAPLAVGLGIVGAHYTPVAVAAVEGLVSGADAAATGADAATTIADAAATGADAATTIADAAATGADAATTIADAAATGADLGAAALDGALTAADGLAMTAEVGTNLGCMSNPVTLAIVIARGSIWTGYRLVKRFMRLYANLRWEKAGQRFGWKRTLTEHPKLYPYYKHRKCFAPTYKNKEGQIKANPLFVTALVANGKNGAWRYDTKDSHFDKVGSIRRSFYIPNGTRVQVLCKEEKITLQHLASLRLGKLAKASKYTVVWNNRYKYIGRSGKENTGKLNYGQIVMLVQFGKPSGRYEWLQKPLRHLWEGLKNVVLKPLGAFRNWEKRYWQIAIVHENGSIEEDTLRTVKEADLEHVGYENLSQARDNSENWKEIEMLGNVNICNLTELRAGTGSPCNVCHGKGRLNKKRIFNKKQGCTKCDGTGRGPGQTPLNGTYQVPGYGELYHHCAPGRCKTKFSIYGCGYCALGCPVG